MKRFLVVFVLVAASLGLLAAPAFAATSPVPTFQTMNGWWGSRSAQVAQPFTFNFRIYHPDPAAVVTDGEIVIFKSQTHKYVTTIPLPDAFVYSTEYDGYLPAPTMYFTWTWSLPTGSYDWYARVTVAGTQNTGVIDGRVNAVKRLR